MYIINAKKYKETRNAYTEGGEWLLLFTAFSYLKLRIHIHYNIFVVKDWLT